MAPRPSPVNSITWTYYMAWCHIKSEYNHFSSVASVRHSRPFSCRMFEESNVSRSLLYSVLSIPALGMEVFWRWIVRSDSGCLGLCDILEATGEQRITNVLSACITQWHADSPLISLFERSLILLAPVYTSTDPYLDLTQTNRRDDRRRKAVAR